MDNFKNLSILFKFKAIVNNGSHTTYVTCNVLVTNHILNKVIFNGKIYYFVNKIFSAKDKFLKIQYDISGEFLSILKQTAWKSV